MNSNARFSEINRCMFVNFHSPIRIADTATDTATESSHGIEPRKQTRNRATETDTELHNWAAVKSPLGAQTVLGDRHDPVCENLLQAPSAACGTRPRELSNGWVRKRKRDGSEKRSSENLIRQLGQRNDLNPGEFASRASLRSCLGARRRARWISARSMFEPGGESVRCQNLHEPLLSPCISEQP